MGTIGKDFKYKIIKNFLSINEINLLSHYCEMKHRTNLNYFDFNQSNLGDTYFYGDPTMESLMMSKKDLMEKETNKNYYLHMLFWRTYTKYAVLKKHTDRPSCEISVTVNINGDGTPWPIFMDGTELNLDIGDAAIYLGCEIEHWRNEFKGDYQFQTFLHYVDAEGKNTEYYMDKRKYWEVKVKFNQQEDGSCDLIFSDEEIKVISKHKKLYFTAEFLRHFSNSLMRMSVEFNERFDEKTKNLITQTDTIMDLGKSKKMIDELFDLPIPQKVNKEVVDYLGKQKWSFVNDNDEKYSNSLYDISTNPSIRDAGQAIITYAKDKEHKRDNLLNFFGHLVFSLIQERSKFKIKNINRLYWNFYTPVSEMNFHVDDHNPGRSISAIYNLHTNDGGTVIQDNFIYSKESQAIIFRSEKLHKGIAPKISNCRLSLNLVMSI